MNQTSGKISLFALLAGLMLLLQPSGYSQAVSEEIDGRPVIQLALLLDTSNSMDGLINQAKSQLWRIVSETGRARRNGREPLLQVALYEYGNDSLSPLSRYIRQVVPFTTDLDYISQELFTLRTNGGNEYCGQVVLDASRQLQWVDSPAALKLIFIAGNEPFTQGPTSYMRASKAADRRGIVVNTIFCGDYSEGIQTGWQNGARLTGGSYISINSDYTHEYIRAPQDERIEELNDRLNRTYLGYGALGQAKKENQEEQDQNASSLNRGSLLERARVKSSSGYSNTAWDLVDAYTEGAVDPSELSDDELPQQMRGLSGDEREEYLQEMQTERMRIQNEITRLSLDRDRYLQDRQASAPAEPTLDSAMIKAVRESAEAKGFVLE
jgi:hypothetical protein